MMIISEILYWAVVLILTEQSLLCRRSHLMCTSQVAVDFICKVLEIYMHFVGTEDQEDDK